MAGVQQHKKPFTPVISRAHWRSSKEAMSQLQALLSHQGPLKHVNHAHRQCAPVPTGRITSDEYGNIVSWGLSDPPPGWNPNATAESR